MPLTTCAILVQRVAFYFPPCRSHVYDMYNVDSLTHLMMQCVYTCRLWHFESIARAKAKDIANVAERILRHSYPGHQHRSGCGWIVIRLFTLACIFSIIIGNNQQLFCFCGAPQMTFQGEYALGIEAVKTVTRCIQHVPLVQIRLGYSLVRQFLPFYLIPICWLAWTKIPSNVLTICCVH